MKHIKTGVYLVLLMLATSLASSPGSADFVKNTRLLKPNVEPSIEAIFPVGGDIELIEIEATPS